MVRKQRLPVMLDPQQIEALREVQARTGASMAEQIRRAIALWLAQQSPKPRRKVGTR